eukprot:1657210-Ditylum_brightwellii.AAC.1
MIKFGMQSALVQYHGKYYAYKGASKGQVMKDEDITITIGAFEPAFSADVVASYAFKMTEVSFICLKYRGIYRDDGLVIFWGKWSKNKIAQCLCWYHTLVDRIAGGTYLQFTTELWAPTDFQQEFDEEHKGKDKDTPDKKWLK